MDSYENYDLQDEDPYLQLNSTCLINCLGIRDTGQLNQAEQEVVSINMAELILKPVQGTFDLSHLSAIHEKLFSDIYPWAGQVRTTEISKSAQLFLPYKLIASTADLIFTELHTDCLLQNLSRQDFIERAAYYLGRINAMHAFREGNGRAQRVFLDQLAELSGYAFEWSAVSGEQMAQACLAARQAIPDYRFLVKIIDLHIKKIL